MSYIYLILYYLKEILLTLYMSTPPVQQQNQMVFHIGQSATELAPLFLIIFTHSLFSDVVPPSFKLAAITPVFKSGDRTAPCNYRPISLTSVISKVLGMIIRKQVSLFIDKKCCLNGTQHGFRSGRSCLSALLSVFDDITHMLKAGGSVDIVYLDFSKAFDKVDHGILHHKLKALGITGHLGICFFKFP